MKDTPDRPDESLPVRRTLSTPVTAPPLVDGYDDYVDPSTQGPSTKRVSFRLVSRAIRRFWWQTLILWMAGSAGLVALAYYKIKPTYDAIAQVSVEQNLMNNILAPVAKEVDLAQFMKTQVAKITSPPILNAALVENPKLLATPMLVGTDDAEADIRSALRVGPIPGSNLIQIEMSSPIPAEAAEIVNAVVTAYLKNAQNSDDVSTKKHVERLEGIRSEQRAEVEKQRKIIEDISKTIGAASETSVKDRNVATIEAYRRWSEELTSIEIRRYSEKSKLDQLRNEKSVPVRPLDEKALQAAIIDAFYADPQVQPLEANARIAEGKLKNVERLSRSPSDPAVVAARKKLKDLTDEKNALWQKLESSIRRQLVAAPVDDTLAKAINKAESDYQTLVTYEDVLRSRLESIRVEGKNAEGDGLKLTFARRDYERAEEMLDKVSRALEQVKLDAKNPSARINLAFKAQPSFKANGDRRTQLMATAPFGLGLLLIGMLVLIELKGARVGDPDELSNRIRLQVIGVVPPLPQIRSGGGGNGSGGNGNLPLSASDLRAQRQLDEFVQSLDHLRVALCARPDKYGRDRHCVLITSACGSEGKTTLAALLAERCVNAGMMTLLIDGDLRNPTLSRMLDAQDNPGLINILRGEMTAEDVIMVIGDAGGFHLIPAGTPRVDPSRLLQSERLGKLLAQARESFDMIIVDAPPVLPVPDALTIGRHTDGAVLAVRYDTSRFPLVERANRRLAHVGVPVIGAVVNGVRSMEATYGGSNYGYGYGYGSGGFGNAAPTVAPVVEE